MQGIINITGTEGHPAHRGVIHLRDGDFLIFGNDGYKEERAKREVETIRQRLAGRADELGFAVDAEGYSWALLVRFLTGFNTNAGREACRSLLTLALWQGWTGSDQTSVGKYFQAYQQKEAETTIDCIRPKILKMLDTPPLSPD